MTNPSFKATLTKFATLLLLLATAPLAAAAEEIPEQMSIIETILHGGPLIIFIWICILGTSVVLITFIIQLYIGLRLESVAPKALIDSLSTAIQGGNYQEAWEIASANKVYIAVVLKSALERLGRGKDAFETALIEYGQREGQIVKTKISYISVIGVVAPMIGLLGTVIGMMGAFAVLGSSGVADPRGLALRIGEVLMATASGLFIAIPAFIYYYYFRNRATIVLVAADEKLALLTEDIPFEELGGIHIGEGGENVSIPPSVIDHKTAAAEAAGAGVSQKVSLADTACPVCNGAITAGQNPCPHCGSTLEWA